MCRNWAIRKGANRSFQEKVVAQEGTKKILVGEHEW